MPKISQYPAQTGASVANGDLFPIVDVGSPNVTEYITADELAQIPQLTSRYKPISGEQIWIDANAMTIYTGSPTKAASSAALGWLLDASTDEGVEGSFMAPPSWTTFDVDCYWYNAGAGSGDVRFNFYRFRYKSATTTLSLGQLTSVTATAGTQNNTVVTRLVSGVADVWSAPGNPWWCAVMRDADNVADTLGNDMCVTGLLLTRAS